MEIGTLVRFAHEQNGGPVHRVASVASDGMVELHDMGGFFAPHLFAIADDIGGIPHSKEDTDLLPCPFCGGKAERIDIEDGDNAGGSCVHCTQCDASSNVEFEFKENFVSNWNRRALPNSVEVLTRAVRNYLIDCDDQDAPTEAFEEHRRKLRSAVAAINT